jgi:hypothetical protein
MFVPWNQVPVTYINLAVRTGAEPADFGTILRRDVGAIDANLPVFEVRTMEERLFDSVAQPRFRTVLLGVFASLALVMAVVGLYAVEAVSVATRYRKNTLTPEDAAIHPEIQTSTPGDRSVPFLGPVSANVERQPHHQGARYGRNRRAS